MPRIAILNQKGGVGKTTTAANLGAALGKTGRRVLLVDLDAQANLTLHLSAGDFEEPSAFEVLVDGRPLREAVRALAEPGLALVPASPDLSGIEQALSGTIGRELLLRDALEAYETEAARRGEGPDLVLLDCPPSLGVLSLNALAAADQVLVPLQTEFFALQGMAQLLEVVRLVARRLNPRLTVLGILPCLVDARTNLSAEVLGELREHFGDLLLESRIRKTVKLAEAPGFGRSIFAYAPDSKGAEDYEALARELRGRLGLREEAGTLHGTREESGTSEEAGEGSLDPRSGSLDSA